MPKKKNKNHYFTKVHEDAIVRYCKSTDNKERNELYKVYIGPVFDEMSIKLCTHINLTPFLTLMPCAMTAKIGL